MDLLLILNKHKKKYKKRNLLLCCCFFKLFKVSFRRPAVMSYVMLYPVNCYLRSYYLLKLFLFLIEVIFEKHLFNKALYVIQAIHVYT
jgi:hypothetical protein